MHFSPIWVTSLAQVRTYAAHIRPGRIISLLAPQDDFPVIPVIEGFDGSRHLKLGLDDISINDPHQRPPVEEDMHKVIEFGQGWDRSAPILIHCWAGISRSTASAFTIACLHNPNAKELDIARAIRMASPTASPNRRMVSFADDLLGRGGRMRAAIEAIGRGALAYEAEPFSFPSSGFTKDM